MNLCLGCSTRCSVHINIAHINLVVLDLPVLMILSCAVQIALEATSRLSGHESRMADLQKDVDSAQRLTRAAQQSAREAADEKAALADKVCCRCSRVDLLSIVLLIFPVIYVMTGGQI